ncbi:Dual specificity protein phosphatase PPS1 [Penicillium subrubescens]|uniref:Dual specificity protein phosphatase PPS1 n=2 Tax=Penicillium subrubescens TaxID=1316194 RepID=A0A1Q5UDN1_9EURO|nr:Dual specificity protein phosphatase PPS1 [Penicillium subrubescens]
MATVVVQQQHALQHSTPPPSPIPTALAIPRRTSPIPNKHLPVCPTGPSPSESASQESLGLRMTNEQTSSLLYPPEGFVRLSRLPSPTVYALDGETLAAALNHQAAQPLPDPSQMFPWLHGLHPDNHLQLGFFSSRKRSARRAPKCWRGITVVKLGGDLTKARIKGAVTAQEVITPSARFLMSDPPEGFSVRNFHIQTAKLAAMSDIVVYAEDGASRSELLALAEDFVTAQQAWRLKNDPAQERPAYNTFVLTSSFADFEKKCPSMVAIDSNGHSTGQVMDFFQWERLEMCSMSRASEISANVFLGPTPEYILRPGTCQPPKEKTYDLLIEASDLANIPGPRFLGMMDKQLEGGTQRMEFPSSGSIVLPSGNTREVEDIVNTIRWIYYLANPEQPAEVADREGDVAMTHAGKKPRRVLIHCADGYTESSLLAVAYYMFAEGVPAPEAWLQLHCNKKRNFFTYPTDVAFLSHIQPRLLQESPASRSIDTSCIWDPDWFLKMDGSLPSRILPYLYLGNLNHANNPDLLRELGIRRVLSIGEAVNWSLEERSKWGTDNLMFIHNVQDNGIDPLSEEIDRCLEFIGKGKSDGTATLVHCRVGVSRSASICIAEVMASQGLSFPRA